jgi:Cdc6-like AAA superfamily ATPase
MICFNPECKKEFTPKTHNQKYCEENCCRVATNKRIMEKYYEKKAIKNGALRNCKKCKAPLSRYNQNNICVLCEKNINVNSKKKVLSILDEIDQLN